jgi:Histidine kinase
MTIQLSKKQLIIIQILFWLVVCTFSFLPVDWSMRMGGGQPNFHVMRRPMPHSHHGNFDMAQFIVKNILLITLFYFNYFFLIPKYFAPRKFKQYFLVSTLLILLVSGVPIMFELVKHHFHFSMNPREFHQFIISLLAAILGIVIPVGFSLTAQYADAEKEKTKAELSFLRSQINHHFLFNSLNNIYSLSIQESKYTSQAIFSLSSIMRHMATATATNKIDLEQELNFIHHYIEIQKLRLSENTKLNYVIKGTAEGKKIAPMLLIPFVENCFKHGVSTSVASNIDIALNISETSIELNTKNNIIAHLDNDNIKSGVGLVNVKKRLEYEYPDHATFNHCIEDGCYKSYLKIELI